MRFSERALLNEVAKCFVGIVSATLNGFVIKITQTWLHLSTLFTAAQCTATVAAICITLNGRVSNQTNLQVFKFQTTTKEKKYQNVVSFQHWTNSARLFSYLPCAPAWVMHCTLIFFHLGYYFESFLQVSASAQWRCWFYTEKVRFACFRNWKTSRYSRSDSSTTSTVRFVMQNVSLCGKLSTYKNRMGYAIYLTIEWTACV